MGMDFGAALEALRNGERVSRRGWNGADMYLSLQVPDAHSKMTQVPDAHSKMTLPYIYMRTAQGDLVPWLASQSDMLSFDWFVLDNQESK